MRRMVHKRSRAHLNWKQRQRAKARLSARFIRTQNIRPDGTLITKSEFLAALKGTAGIKTHIASNLKCSLATVYRILALPTWQDMRDEYQMEVETGLDDAEETIRHCITQRTDLALASLTARWLLSKQKKEIYGDDSRLGNSKVTVVHEGGDKPIQTMNANLNVDALNLPLEVRRQILAAYDAKAEEERQKAISAEAIIANRNGT